MMANKLKPGRVLLWGVVILVLFFLAIPIFVVFPISLSASSYLEFPPKSLSLQWYHNYFSSDVWISATALSFKVGLMVMIVASILGTLAAFGFDRGNVRWKSGIFVFLLSPMIIPHIVISVGIYSFFARLHLIENYWGLVLGHSIIASPFVFINVFAALQGFDKTLTKASASLGAHPFRTFYHITFPLIRPGIFVGALFAFLTSFDELVISMWVSGTRHTLPVQMWLDVRLEINPTLAAVSSLLIALSILTFFSAAMIRRRTERKYS
ncbi:MAG: ABC transporter permease [bacterium]|nr:ABC transporter permease [bacterium]